MRKVAFIYFTLDNSVWIQHLENILRYDGISQANEFAIAFPKSDEGMNKLTAVAAYADVSDDSEYRASLELGDYIDFDALGNQISEDREGRLRLHGQRLFAGTGIGR